MRLRTGSWSKLPLAPQWVCSPTAERAHLRMGEATPHMFFTTCVVLVAWKWGQSWLKNVKCEAIPIPWSPSLLHNVEESRVLEGCSEML